MVALGGVERVELRSSHPAPPLPQFDLAAAQSLLWTAAIGLASIVLGGGGAKITRAVRSLRSLGQIPLATKVMIGGGLLMGLDYFGIDKLRINHSGIHFIWGTDYHIDTWAGAIGALLLGTGIGTRMTDSPEFRKRLGRFLMGEVPPERHRQSGLIGTPMRGVNGIFSFFERVSVPIFGADFVHQQFTNREAEDRAKGVQLTPHLSIVGGLAFCLAGNRAAISLFGIRPSGQRFYFLFDRLLDMYEMYTSGTTSYLNADWARIGLKYNSGWVVGQIRGNILRFALARAYGNRFLGAIRIEAGGLRSGRRVFREISRDEQILHRRLLLWSRRGDCRVSITRDGMLLGRRPKPYRLRHGDTKSLLNILGLKKFDDLFAEGQKSINLAVSPVLNKRGLTAFALFHDTVIGTMYDYIRGEYIIFGDGLGYAQWTLLRSVSILPLRTAFKAWLGWHSGAAVLFDQLLGRWTIDPYFTNWTRLYAKRALWWPHYESGALAGRDLGKFLRFHTGDLRVAASGVDTWNRNHFPANRILPEYLRDPAGSEVDTYAPAYRFLAEKLLKGELSRQGMEDLDELVANLIQEARDGIAETERGRRIRERYHLPLQTVIDHAEVYAAIAYAVRRKRVDAFPKTFRRHGAWIDELLAADRPATPEDVETLATKFGEYTWFGNSLQDLPHAGGYLPAFTEGRSKGYQIDEKGRVISRR